MSRFIRMAAASLLLLLGARGSGAAEALQALLASPESDPAELARRMTAEHRSALDPSLPRALALNPRTLALALDAIGPGGQPRWSWFAWNGGQRVPAPCRSLRTLNHLSGPCDRPCRAEIRTVQRALGAPRPGEPVVGPASICHLRISDEQLPSTSDPLPTLGCCLVVLSFAPSVLETGGRLEWAERVLASKTEAVLLHRWDVAPEPTRWFLDRFYRSLANTSGPAEALFVARRGLMRQQGGRYRHPHFWAAWTLIQSQDRAFVLPRRPLPATPLSVSAALLGLGLGAASARLRRPHATSLRASP
jgi:hypothetical protein